MFRTLTDARIPILSWCGDADESAMRQACDVANVEVTFHHMALMPDCHVGFGMPIGGVAACVDAVIPNAVGVDIGCGVIAAKTSAGAAALDRKTLTELLVQLKQRIPVGFEHHGSAQRWEGWDRAPDQCAPVRAELESARRQLGTLGGGNHFMEVQSDDEATAWLMIHSGSRNFGLKIAEYYHQKAVRACDKTGTSLPTRELAFLRLDTADAREYLAAMQFALDFARANRALMMDRFGEIFTRVTDGALLDVFQIHHNYCAREEHFGREVMVHRKGATSARKGERGIIPGSMGTPSYIVRGLGNPDSFCSCSHGAGRRMGRNEANRKLTQDACKQAMRGICFEWPTDRKGRPDLSEAPQAYKDIDAVMAAQADLVEPVTRLRPMAVLKG